MITLKPLPREKPMTKRQEQVRSLHNFTIHTISQKGIDPDEMAWVAGRVAHMLGGTKKDMSSDDINTAIEYIRFLLSKMQLLKTKKLTALARELFNPGGGRKTSITSFPRPRKNHRRTKN